MRPLLSHTDFQSHYARAESAVSKITSFGYASQVIYNQVAEVDTKLAKKWSNINGRQDAYRAYSLPIGLAVMITMIAFGVWISTFISNQIALMGFAAFGFLFTMAAFIGICFWLGPRIAHFLFAKKAAQYFPDRDYLKWMQLGEMVEDGVYEKHDTQSVINDLKNDIQKLVLRDDLYTKLEAVIDSWTDEIEQGNVVDAKDGEAFCHLVQRASDWDLLNEKEKSGWHEGVNALLGTQELLENQELTQSVQG